MFVYVTAINYKNILTRSLGLFEGAYYDPETSCAVILMTEQDSVYIPMSYRKYLDFFENKIAYAIKHEEKICEISEIGISDPSDSDEFDSYTRAVIRRVKEKIKGNYINERKYTLPS